MERDESGGTKHSHGLPGKVLVHGGQQYYCIECGAGLLDGIAKGLRKTIHCANKDCGHYEWDLLRPDLYSCDVLSKPEAK